MRIAMIIQSYHPHIGGAERQLAAISKKMVGLGHDVQIFTRRYDARLLPFEEIDGIPVHRIPTPGPKAMASLSFSALAQPQLLKFRPDVIHAHELLSPATTAVLAKRLQRVPVVAKVVTGGTFGDIHKLKTRWSGPWRSQILSKRVDSFIAISKEIDRELGDIAIPLGKRAMIPNGVDINRFAPVDADTKFELRQRLNLPQGATVLFSGRLTRQKRLDLLLKSWPWIRHHSPDATLLIIGTGEEEAALKNMAGSGVTFLGKQEDVAPYLQAADLFVLPSDAEGLSNSMLEAMACGLPPVVTNVGAAPQIIRPNENGWLVEPSNQTALETSLGQALSLVGDLDAVRHEARKTVVERFSLDAVVAQLLKLYSDISVKYHPTPHHTSPAIQSRTN